MNMPGEHWIAFFGNARQEVEMFDSFGLPPNVYDGVHQFIVRLVSRWKRLWRTLQKIGTEMILLSLL